MNKIGFSKYYLNTCKNIIIIIICLFSRMFNKHLNKSEKIINDLK